MSSEKKTKKKKQELGKESSGKKVSKESSGEKVSKESSGEKVSKESSGEKVSKESSGEKVSKESSGEKVSKESSGEKVSKESAGEKVSKESAGEKVSKESAGEKVKAKADDFHLPKPSFSTFVLSLGSSALVQMGEVPNPETGQTAENLKLAKHTVDILNMLDEKIKNGLNDDESRLMEGLLYELRMKYLIKTK